MDIVKENRAIQYLKAFEPQDKPYYLCYSGGKDSDTVRILAELAGVKYDLIHNLTTIDAPETVYYVRDMGAKIIRPPKSMCVGCPMKNTKGMLSDFERYPKYRALYVAAFDRMIARRAEKGLPPYQNWSTGEDVIRWWIGGDK